MSTSQQPGVGTPENRPTAAALSMLSAMALIGLIDNFIARISESIGLWQFVMLRSLLMMPLLILMSRIGLGRLRPIRWKPVIARGIMLSTSMFLYFGALGLMPIAEALAGLFTSPIFVLLINAIIQRKRIGPWRILAVVIGFCGILMVLQPGARGFSPVMIMPVAAGFFYAISSIATRSWCAGESATILLGANMVLLGGMATLVQVGLTLWRIEDGSFLARSWVWLFWDVLPLLMLQAVGSLVGVFFIIRAYQLDEPSNVAVFEYSIMIFAPVFAWVLFGQGVGVLQLAGIAMIASAGVIIAVRSR
ncbi:DMT family transporter [Shimia sp.]|uniref:DMT family transporter n=1 Tax=Shimia sp. TaxID=1954381 RepID=UPI003299D3D6